MRKLALLFLVLFVSQGLSASLERLDITVDLDESGNAVISEEYVVSIGTPEDVLTFENLTIKGKTDLWMWSAFVQGIDAHMLGDRQNLYITATRFVAGFGKVSVTYEIPEFATVLRQEGRLITRGVTIGQLSYYDTVEQVLTIPPDASLLIAVPDVRKDNTDDPTDYMTVVPRSTSINAGRPTITNNKITSFWRGPFVTAEFSVSYTIERSIGESFDLQRILTSTYDFFAQNPIYSFSVLIILALVVIYRRQIFGLVSESFGGEEEVEAPKKEIK